MLCLVTKCIQLDTKPVGGQAIWITHFDGKHILFKFIPPFFLLFPLCCINNYFHLDFSQIILRFSFVFAILSYRFNSNKKCLKRWDFLQTYFLAVTFAASYGFVHLTAHTCHLTIFIVYHVSKWELLCSDLFKAARDHFRTTSISKLIYYLRHFKNSIDTVLIEGGKNPVIK